MVSRLKWVAPRHLMVDPQPADVLVRDWIAGRFAAFDFTMSSPLSVTSLNQACTTSGSTAESAEARKHR